MCQVVGWCCLAEVRGMSGGRVGCLAEVEGYVRW